MTKLRNVTGNDGQADFAAALSAALNPEARKRVAAALEVTPAMVSNWSRAVGNAPRPDQVFAIEEALGLHEGELSRHLGYVRVGSTSVLAAIDADASLSSRDRNALAALYRSMSSPSVGAES